MTTIKFVLALWTLFTTPVVMAFAPSIGIPAFSSFNVVALRQSTVAASSPSEASAMRLRDIQDELKRLGVSYHDCFDRESLVYRLVEARKSTTNTSTERNATAASVYAPPPPPTTTTTATTTTVEMEAKLVELRSKPLKELKLECSKRSMRYATFREKEDFVRALWQDMQASLAFSATGILRQGTVTELTGDQLDVEMNSRQHHDTPILVDVFATWCGPCKMVVPQLEAAAQKLGHKARVVKLDSDKHSAWAGRYQVQGLPTMLLIQNGRVVDRLEGAHMTDAIVDLVERHSS